MTDEKLIFHAGRTDNTSSYLSNMEQNALEEIAEELMRRFPTETYHKKEYDEQKKTLLSLKFSVMDELAKRDNDAKEAEQKKNFQMSDEELTQLAIRVLSNPDSIANISDNKLHQVSLELLRRYPPVNGVDITVSGTLKDRLTSLKSSVMTEIKRREATGIVVREKEDIAESISFASGVYLNNIRGAKTNIIRVFDALWEMRYFTNGQEIITKGELMKAVGLLLNEDLSNFESILSQSYNNTKAETNLTVFDEMRAKIQAKCISKT